ncbi:CPBP family intramembrane glutamic endopeptidase [Enorma massiliensis]|uniref:CPBP family intramembrane glutamic endopeptidase n=1 Tax=Enorma massiliensis TaxID=1472761 RepID=UPI001EF48585|nr:CPBP family intramembrane glutamic endopeptidase [Enorma massiliensis]
MPKMDASQRWKNLLLAALAFVLMIVMPTLASYVVSYAVIYGAGFVGGEPAIVHVVAFMNENMNLYSALVYLVFGIPVLFWVRGMRNRERVRLRHAQLEQQFLESHDAYAEQQPFEPAAASGQQPFVPAAAPGRQPLSGGADSSQRPIASGTDFASASFPEPPRPPARYIYYGDRPVAWQLASQGGCVPQAQDGGAPQAQDGGAPQAQALASVQAELSRQGHSMPTVNARIQGVDHRHFVAAALMGYGMQIVTTLIMVLVNVLLPSVMEEYNTLVDGSGITTYGLMWVISTLVLPPLVEEAGFRGLGLTYLERAGVPFAAANIVQALAFGIFHMNLTQGIYTFVLGLALGYVTHRSGSIAPAMLMHLVYNLMGTLGSDLIYSYLPAPFLILLATNVIALVYAFRLLRPKQGRGAAAMQA